MVERKTLPNEAWIVDGGEALPDKAWAVEEEKALPDEAWVVEGEALPDEAWMVEREALPNKAWAVERGKALPDEAWVVEQKALPNKAWVVERRKALPDEAWVVEGEALSDEAWMVEEKGQVVGKKGLPDKGFVWWYKSHLSIFTNEFVEKCKKLTSSASIVSRAALLYLFRFRVPPRKELHSIVTGASFSNRTDATISCAVPTLISTNE